VDKEKTQSISGIALRQTSCATLCSDARRFYGSMPAGWLALAHWQEAAATATVPSAATEKMQPSVSLPKHITMRIQNRRSRFASKNSAAVCSITMECPPYRHGRIRRQKYGLNRNYCKSSTEVLGARQLLPAPTAPHVHCDNVITSANMLAVTPDGGRHKF